MCPRICVGLLFIAVALMQVTSAVGEARTRREDSGEEGDSDISILADELLVAVGEDVHLVCTLLIPQPVIWFHPNGSDINSLNSTRMEYNATSGELSLSEVELTDAGNYTCQSQDGEFVEWEELEVYVMPDYFLEGMIILGINACLVLVFIVCMVYGCVQAHQLKKKAEKEGFLKPVNGQGTSYTAGLKGAL